MKSTNFTDKNLNSDLLKNNLGQNKTSATAKVGDAIERAGDYIGEKVSKKAGDAIHKLGDKIEHAND